MRWWSMALPLLVACSGKSANESSPSDGGAENGGASSASSGGSAGTTQGGSAGTSGSDGGSNPTSGGGTTPTGGSGASAGTGVTGGDGGTNGGSGGVGGEAASAGASATGGDGGSTGACMDATTLEECDARDDCHSVFVDPNDCDCLALGCCARFSFCADGGTAVCDAMVTCRRAPPYCEGSYVVSYVGSCYEGCVRNADCAP